MDTIPKLQEDMKNPDPHFRQNAVIAFGKYFEDESKRSKLTEPEKATIVKHLLKCLNPEEKSVEVKARTVKVFKIISIYLKEAEINQIFKESLNYIITPNREGKDIFVDCMKNILEKVPETFYDTIGKIIVEPLSKGLDSSDKETLILCIDTLNKYISKFDYMLIKEKLSFKLNKQQYISVAIKNISDNDETLKARALEFLETLGALLDKKEIEQTTKQILELFEKSNSLTELKDYINALKSLAKTCSAKQTNYYQQILSILSKYINLEFLENDSGDYDEKNKVVESAINCLEIYIGTALSQIKKEIPKVIDNLNNLLSYDPNYSYENVDDEPVDIEGYEGYEDYAMDANLDDSSWVVRRASCRALLTILNSGYNMQKGEEEKIIKKLIECLREHEENTKVEIIQCLMAYLDSLIIVQEDQGNKLVLMRKKSTIVADFIPQVSKQLIDMILNDLKRKDKVILTNVLKLLPCIAAVAPEEIIHNFNSLKESLDETCFTSNENTLILLQFLKKLFQADNIDNDYKSIYNTIIGYIIKGLKNSYYKICSESINVCYLLFPILAQDIEINTPSIKGLYREIYPKFSVQDIDYEIKVATVNTIGNYIIECGTLLKPDEIKQLFEIYAEKANNEMIRSDVLTALNNIANNDNDLKLNDVFKLLKDVILNILTSAPIQIQTKTLVLLESIFKKYPKSLLNNVGEIAKKLFELKNQESLIVLIFNVFKNMITWIDAKLIKSIYTYIDTSLQSMNVEKSSLKSLFEFVKLSCQKLGKKELINIVKDYTSKFKNLNENLSYFVSILICYSGEEKKVLETLFTYLSSTKDDKEIVNFLLLIGNICENSTEEHDDLITQLEKLKSKLSNRANDTISKTTGKIGANNPNAFITKIIKEKPNQGNLTAMKEFLELIAEKGKEISENDSNNLVNWLISTPNLKDEYTNKYVGLCAGLLICANQKLIIQYINLLKEKSGEQKSSLLNGLGVVLKSKKKIDDNSLNELIEIIISGLKQTDRLIKEHSIQGLNSLKYEYKDNLLNFYRTDDTRCLILKSCEIDKNFIKEADFGGGNKIIEDKGIEIRKAAYEIVTFIIDKFPNKINFQETVPLMINCLMETEDYLQNVVYSNLAKLAKLNPSSFSPYGDLFIDTLFKVWKRIKIEESKKNFSVNVKKIFEEVKDVQSITGNPRYDMVVQEINKH